MSNTYYCPNCEAEVSSDAVSCQVCRADFGSSSAWKAKSTATRRAGPKTPVFSRKPKMVHAAQSIGVFAVLGPLVGLLLTAMVSESKGDLAFVTHPFAIVGAFAVGGSPALVAGLLYCAVALGLVTVFPRVTIGAVAGGAIGVLAGYVAAAGYFHLLLHGNPNRVARIVEMANLSAGPGFICGFAAAWLIPVGRSDARASGG